IIRPVPVCFPFQSAYSQPPASPVLPQRQGKGCCPYGRFGRRERSDLFNFSNVDGAVTFKMLNFSDPRKCITVCFKLTIWLGMTLALHLLDDCGREAWNDSDINSGTGPVWLHPGLGSCTPVGWRRWNHRRLAPRLPVSGSGELWSKHPAG